MPARYRRRKNKKGPHRRRGHKHRLANYVPSGASPVAKKHICRLKYSQIDAWSVATLNTATQFYRLNSLFDPDATGGGHQPYGFDQLAALFAHYRVYKCKWHIEFSGSNDRLHICVLPINGINASTTIPAVSEQPLAVTKAMSFNGGFPIKFKGSAYLPKLTGASSVQYRTDDRYSAAVSASPTEAMQLGIYVYNPGASTVATSCNVTLVYYSEMYDPITLGQS